MYVHHKLDDMMWDSDGESHIFGFNLHLIGRGIVEEQQLGAMGLFCL